ncbi:MAG: protein kinase [Candidatus Krumholzibacteria bacterium]|nr:protein kinase [Candidatus Krumholzibacteria bacterium]
MTNSDDTIPVNSSDEPTADLGRGRDKDLPAKIGSYVIKRVIASGGMGTVYEAMQENPRRPAAVKVVKANMASDDALRRFEREAQALARMRHPGIAQIYEAGTFLDGNVTLPFFALEYIPNASTIIEFAKARGYGLRQKLELFLQVCEAIHYGHQRGIIHRDLKPGNILVDSEARARVIDFGVARAVDADQEPAADHTQVGQILGTAPYMSPEQFDADPNDLDTRSDVYALGVVLYELLSGKLPYAVAGAGVFEVARAVREDQPPPLRSLVKGLDSEVEIIVGKVLQKNRDERYQSAFGLAEDIRHYLQGEAISAKPASLAYQMKIIARKNQAAVGLALLTVVLLAAGVVTTSTLYLRVSAERTKAEESAQHAIAANEFLTNTLAAAVPHGFGDAKTIGDLCDRAREDLDGAFPDNPTTEADVRNTIGQIYSKLDKRPQAEEQLSRAHTIRRDQLGRLHEETLQALGDLAFFYFVFGPPEKALSTGALHYELLSEAHGEDHELCLVACLLYIETLVIEGQFAQAERLSRQQIESLHRVHGQNGPEVVEVMSFLAFAQLSQGNQDTGRATAIQAYELALKLPGQPEYETSGARAIYASALLNAGELDAAKELYGHRSTPAEAGIESAFQGEMGSWREGIDVLVFFETWCPFSQKYMPTVEEFNRQYTDSGVNFVGLTRVNRSSSEMKVRQFILDGGMTMPVFRENGRSWNYFEAAGTPFTVILHEGEVIWQSSGVGNLSARLLEGILTAK